MIVLHIADVKNFMKKLLISKIFDKFLLNEVTIVTSATYNIEGKINKDFFDNKDELEVEFKDKYVEWGKVKPICFELIKGKVLPLNLKIVMQLSSANTKKFISQSTSMMNSEDITGLFLNITFDRKDLRCVTGTSLKTFTMDKTVDKEWDLMIEKFFRQNEIEFE